MSEDLPLDYPVKVGSMLYTLVDPHVGHELAYNRWYERDHFYGGCMIGPWLFAGSRWVATRELKELRIPKDSTNTVTEPYDRGTYVAIYWVHEGHHDEHFGWASEQVKELYSAGRGFAERTHAHTVLYGYAATHYRDDDPVPLELALDHGFAGHVSVAMDRAEGVSADQLGDFLSDVAMNELMTGSGIAQGSTWIPIERDEMTKNAPMDLGSDTGSAGTRTMQLFFTDNDVRVDYDRFGSYASQINESGLATVVVVAPFHKTVVGTDRYVDEIW